MGGTGLTRRRLLGVLGGAGATALGAGAVSNAMANDGWSVVETPTGNALYDAAYAGSTPYAVGGSGVLLRRDGQSWTTVVSDGTGRNKTLRACAVTTADDRLWFCGASGTLGYLDVASGTTTDLSKPVEEGNTFYDVAVEGAAGEERVYLATSGGDVVVGHQNTGSWTWTEYDTGGGYTVTALDFHDARRGHAVTNGSAVYETTDGGQTWTRVGIEDAQVPLKAVVSQPNRVYVGGGSGRVYRLDCTCDLWTPFKPGSDTVSALERYGGELLGAGGSGHLVERTETGYVMYESPTGNHLNGVALGRDGGPDVAVGDGGVLLER